MITIKYAITEELYIISSKLGNLKHSVSQSAYRVIIRNFQSLKSVLITMALF